MRIDSSMPDSLLTHFKPDPRRQEPLLPASEYFGAMDAEAEWPGNILSNRMVVYEDGTIARRDDPVTFAVEPEELALCHRLADRAAASMGQALITNYPYQRFFIAANTQMAVPSRIDTDLIRARFGGTIFPMAEVAVEPLTETAQWWNDLKTWGAGESELDAWRASVNWFREQPEFIDTAYVRIGENLDEANAPPSPMDVVDWYVEQYGVVRPRLALGLTAKGSLAGWAFCEVRA
jgi:hypothetical protein